MMKLRLLCSVLCLALVALPGLRAQDAANYAAALAANDAFEAVMKKMQARMQAGDRTAEAFAPELKELEENIAEFATDKDSAARFAFVKAMLFAEVIEDLPKARALLEAVQRDYPGTEAAEGAGQALNRIAEAMEQDATTPELKPLINEIVTKARAGSRTEAAFTAEIAKFDALIAKYSGNAKAAATLVLAKAMFRVQVLGQAEQGRQMLVALQEKYPGTGSANAARQVLAQLDEAAQQEAARDSAKAALIGQAAPELNFTWASKAGLKTLSSLKGQVVVLDFWATWCGPCIRSFPQIREHVARFKGAPVTFIGVTSLQGYVANLESGRIDTKDNPAKETGLMPAFMKKHDITWNVAFSEEPVFNPAYGIEGIPFLAIIAPDGTVRHAGLHPGDPDADVAGKIEAILKEFKLPLPKAE